MRQIRATLMFASIVVMASAVALAEDYEFTGNGDGSSWHDGENWTPGGGPPEAGDTANIPVGKVCEVVTYDEACKEIYVYGTVKIISTTLTIGTCLDNSTSIIDGELRFEKPGSLPKLAIDVPNPTTGKKLTITGSGSGTIVASDGDGGDKGRILNGGS